VLLRKILTVLALVSFSIASPMEAAGGKAAAVKHFANERCGYAFSYPATWRVSLESGNDDPCVVLLRPRDFAQRMRDDGVDVYTIRVTHGEGDFDAAAAANEFAIGSESDESELAVEEHAGEWLYVPSLTSAVADLLQDGECRGLQATSASRCYFEDGGGYAGLCEIFVAFVAHRGEWLAAEGHDDTAVLTVLGSAVLGLERRPAPPDHR
jgi:hypothetical protein